MKEVKRSPRIKTIISLELPMRTSLDPKQEIVPHHRIVTSIRYKVDPAEDLTKLAVMEANAHREVGLEVVATVIEDAALPVKLRH